MLNRRQFNRAVLASAVFTAPRFLRAQNANEKLNIAAIGVGGRGLGNITSVAGENIAFLCDVSQTSLNAAKARFPQARTESDFRRLFDRAKEFDAVVVSTAEHTHAHATMLALRAGKHVYCEKPLTHGIWEARRIREEASKLKVATQMGIQIHATENYRRVVEIIRSGIIGPIRECEVWVSRAWGWQSAEDAKRFGDIVSVTERPRETETVPMGLDWDLWLGPAPQRPFHSVYVPGPKWYRWWDFGSGTMSDLGSHWIDLPFWALELRAPLTIEAKGPPPHPELAPASMSAIYEYGPRGDKPAVKLTWHQGVNKPDLWKENKIPQWNNGVLFVGAKGMLLSDYSRFVLLPENDFRDVRLPDRSLPRTRTHHQEWLDACKGKGETLADFTYGGWLTEANHLGNIAYRLGKKLEWDATALRVRNTPEADALIRRAYRKGWEL